MQKKSIKKKNNVREGNWSVFFVKSEFLDLKAVIPLVFSQISLFSPAAQQT